MGKKIWKSRDRTPDRPSAPQAYQCKITQLTGMTPQTTRGVLGGEIVWPPELLERKNNNKVVSFSTLFLMFEGVIQNKGDEFRWEKNMKIS